MRTKPWLVALAIVVAGCGGKKRHCDGSPEGGVAGNGGEGGELVPSSGGAAGQTLTGGTGGTPARGGAGGATPVVGGGGPGGSEPGGAPVRSMGGRGGADVGPRGGHSSSGAAGDDSRPVSGGSAGSAGAGEAGSGGGLVRGGAAGEAGNGGRGGQFATGGGPLGGGPAAGAGGEGGQGGDAVAAAVSVLLDRTEITAGEAVTATCQVVDTAGRVLTDHPTTLLTPTAAQRDGAEAVFTTVGSHSVTCLAEGVAESAVASVLVTPGAPANLAASLSPPLAVYAPGASLSVDLLVTDAFSNEIPDAPTELAASGGTRAGDAFTFAQEGHYTITATVVGTPLARVLDVVVDGTGPLIECVSPAFGVMLTHTPGSTVLFRGAVADTSSIESVTVNGVGAVVEDGAFQQRVDTAFGINWVTVEATDEHGMVRRRNCPFLVSERWGEPSLPLADTLSLALRQAAVDQLLPQDVVAPEDIARVGDAALVAANPLAQIEQCVPYLGCVNEPVEYVPRSFAVGSTVSSIRLADAGLQVRFRAEDLQIQIEGFGVRVPASMSSIDATMTLGPVLEGGVLRVRSASDLRVTAGTLSIDGIPTSLVPVVERVISSEVANAVEGLQGDIVREINAALQTVELGQSQTVAVERFDGGVISLALETRLASVQTNAERMLLGAESSATALPVIALPTNGIALRHPLGSVDPGPPGTANVAIAEPLVNQALHALWRAGFLDAALDTGWVPLQLISSLPPVITFEEQQRAVVSVGGVLLRIGGLEPPMDVEVLVRAESDVTIVGGGLQFGPVRLLDGGVQLSSADPRFLDEDEVLLKALLEQELVPALDAALTELGSALVLPTLETEGGSLTVVNPLADSDPGLLFVRGDLGPAG